MAQSPALAELIQRDRPNVPFAPGRIGRHEVWIETFTLRETTTVVYHIRHGRVLAMLARSGYREDIAAALLEAVDELMDMPDLGAGVHLRPLGVAGVRLDRAALFGPGHTGFFATRPEFADCALQVVPVHSSELADGDDIEGRARGRVFGKVLGLDHRDWDRLPVPAARVQRVDDSPGGRYRANRRARNMTRPASTIAQDVFDRDLPEALHGPQEITVEGVFGQRFRLRRRFDRVIGTLRLPGDERVHPVDIPRDAGWALFGPLFHTGRFDPADLAEAALRPATPMLELRLRNRYRADDRSWPHTLDSALLWVHEMDAVPGHFVVFEGRSGGCLHMIWRTDPAGGDPLLWLETPDPEAADARGRYVTRTEAAHAVTILAEQDRIALDQ
ncbi:hypothetical protein [Nocardia huaxiensis]|uniref:Uncharacterized protein n=1 Tax=Nocardia huaxiensis TaxID=2755382 RepID=A0A7D6VED9_9NOCA|nr:hypothetical protein [Nocardia huaxiensis]QLY28196.1 hypothetical protein H0264_22690 [Nocardia huaxiensis]UFS98369.1 hypothetical protein LPY97_10945 [Nocardia huaxiensis]